MPSVNNSRALQMIVKGVQNLILKRPLAVSFEVTHSCDCDCKHCDKSGNIPDEILASPERIGDLARELRPLVAQISGGEPLLRSDIYDIIKEVKVWGKLPVVVFVTNARLLTEEKYLKLKEIGVDEFSISLDFPDERHDKNRKVPGLYKHLDELIPKLASYNNNDITMICVIREQNLNDLPAAAEQAIEWNVNMNFSVYTTMRTNDTSISVQRESLELLRKQIDYLIEFKKKTGRIFTSESVFNKYYEFFSNGSNIPNCKAGYRSLVVNPDGKIVSCALFYKKSYNTQKELIDNFSKNNTCGRCYVSMRANTEKSTGLLIKDALASYKQIRRNKIRS